MLVLKDLAPPLAMHLLDHGRLLNPETNINFSKIVIYYLTDNVNIDIFNVPATFLVRLITTSGAHTGQYAVPKEPVPETCFENFDRITQFKFEKRI